MHARCAPYPDSAPRLPIRAGGCSGGLRRSTCENAIAFSVVSQRRRRAFSSDRHHRSDGEPPHRTRAAALRGVIRENRRAPSAHQLGITPHSLDPATKRGLPERHAEISARISSRNSPPGHRLKTISSRTIRPDWKCAHGRAHGTPTTESNGETEWSVQRTGRDAWFVSVPTSTGRVERRRAHRATARAIERMLIEHGPQGQRALGPPLGPRRR